ncbi:MAG: Piwi domain-containing protein [Cyanobacteria bacterium P01_A01_bin.116]
MKASDPRIAAYPKLLGQVQAVDGEHLQLTDTKDGRERVLASEVFLEPRKEAFKRCLAHIFREKAPAIEKRLENVISDFRSGPARLKQLQAVSEHLSKKALSIVPGVPFSLHAFLSEGYDNLPTIHKAPSATYVFDATGSKTSNWNDGGLTEYGPYDSRTFTPSTPRICIICQHTRQGQVEQFLYKLLNGVTVASLSKKGKRQPFAKGFVDKYALDGVETKIFFADDNTPQAYESAVRQALVHQKKEGFIWDLALVQIDEAFQLLYGDENPYLTTKVAFLSEQIPTQKFKIETIDVADSQLCYVLNSIALAMYAKLGGIPWLIESNRVITHELVFGLGSAIISKGRLGQKEQVVGITTVFAGDGNYMLSNLSTAVPMSEYKAALLDSLRETVIKVKHAMNWEVGSRVRLIFHAFKPMKNNEADAVKQLMEELGEYDVEYAFVHIVNQHPYILFDEAQPGIYDWETKKNGKGEFAPERKLFFRLSKHEVLLCLTGAKEVKRPQDGIPSPVLLRLHHSSTFKDTTYLARQVYTFSCHSWRSFMPASMPMTIEYSQLIAKMLGQLGTVSFWNPNAMLGRIGETRWFL